MKTKTLGTVFFLLISASAWGAAPCGDDLVLPKYRAHDPTEAATLFVRARRPHARVIYMTSRDRRGAWLVTLTVRESDRTFHQTFEVTDNYDGTLNVREMGND